MAEMTDTLRRALIAQTPRVLSLLDKNPYSRTYGSLDRKYWHYKIIDFPCGMQQELILPLAYVWLTAFEGNPYHQLPRIKDYLEGILSYHAKSCHPDGSLDDYFPHERAFGATAYALTALTEAALMTGLRPAGMLDSFEKSGEFLRDYREAGKLSNHLAIAAAALMNLSLLTGKALWKEHSDRLIEELAAMQHTEGWFPEYEGCDLGYQTVTVEFLARRYRKAPSEPLLTMLVKNVRFLREFTHPDGSFGGEYGSRNTYNFYPGGFAILSARVPEAAEMLGFFFRGLARGTGNHLEDDGIFGHLLSSYVTVLTCEDARVSELPAEAPATQPFIRFFSEAGLFAGRTGQIAFYGTTTKGGVFKVFRGDWLEASDTGFVGELSDGTRFCQNKAKASQGVVSDTTIEITGGFKKFSSKRLTRVHMMGLRLLSILFGRFRWYSNAIRNLMQKVLIYGSDQVPVNFRRTIQVGPRELRVRDELSVAGTQRIVLLHRSTDCVNMHVITSDSFQTANLLGWEKMAIEPGRSVLAYEKVFREDS